jgi:hypothetical protein
MRDWVKEGVALGAEEEGQETAEPHATYPPTRMLENRILWNGMNENSPRETASLSLRFALLSNDTKILVGG